MSFAQELKIESWIWFSFACVIVIMRYTSRYMQRGTIKRFQFDDYAMAPVFVSVPSMQDILYRCVNKTDAVLLPWLDYHCQHREQNTDEPHVP